MDKAPKFLQRIPVEKKFDPRVHEFLADFAATGEAMVEQRKQIERMEIELDKLHARLGYNGDELKRVARARDQFQAQYCELKIHLEVIVTTAVAACDSAKIAANSAKKACVMAAEDACNVADSACQTVIDQARSTLAQVKAELVKAGIEPPGEDTKPLTPLEEKAIRELGARFAPKP